MARSAVLRRTGWVLSTPALRRGIGVVCCLASIAVCGAAWLLYARISPPFLAAYQHHDAALAGGAVSFAAQRW
jgi:hypothetical protein